MTRTRNAWSSTVLGLATLGATSATSLAQVAGEEALTADSVWAQLGSQFAAGGTTMWFILGLSLLGLAFVLERTFRLNRRALVPPGLADKADVLWKQGDLKGIDALCDKHRKSAMAHILKFIIRHRSAPKADIDSSVVDMATAAIDHHMMLAYPLAAIGALAPLVGLFGTIIGMMGAFKDLALAGELSNPMMLADDISKALVTTAFGLVVAIPAIFFFNFFRFRTNYLSQLLEEETTGVMTAWFMEQEGI